MMRVRLKDLKLNPQRSFKIDPINQEAVKSLVESIDEYGFWSGVVCRKRDGVIEIGAGHCRVEAAMLAGITKADVVVRDFDDGEMARVYATENSTQRGNTSTALVGAIAAAVKTVAKAVLTGKGTSDKFIRGLHGLNTLKGQIQTERGLGAEVITAFLDKVPGMNIMVVKQQLAILKASGGYAEVIEGVRQEIESENAEALAALAKAKQAEAEAEAKRAKAEEDRKAAEDRKRQAQEVAERQRAEQARKAATEREQQATHEKAEASRAAAKHKKEAEQQEASQAASSMAEKREKTFDHVGVARHFNNPSQVDAFLKSVTGPGVKPYLPVAGQAALAKAVVKSVEDSGRKLTAESIRDEVAKQVLDVTRARRKLKADEEEVMRRASLEERARNLMHHFARQCGAMFTDGEKITKLLAEWPRGLAFPVTAEFRENVHDTLAILSKLARKFPRQ